MKNLNDKSQFFSRKKKICYSGVALITLLSVSSVSQAMDKDSQDFPREFLIKNVKTQKYIYVANDKKIADGNKAVLGTPNKSQASVFAVEKDTNGILIKNINSKEYLFSSNYSQYGIGYKYSAAKSNKMEDCYFYIQKEDAGVVIKSKKNKEYFYISNSFNSYDYILSSDYLNEMSYFIFETYESKPSPKQKEEPMKRGTPPPPPPAMEPHPGEQRPANPNISSQPMKRGTPPPPPLAMKPHPVKQRPANPNIMQQPFDLQEEIQKVKDKLKKIGPVLQKPGHPYSLFNDPAVLRMLDKLRDAIDPKNDTE